MKLIVLMYGNENVERLSQFCQQLDAEAEFVATSADREGLLARLGVLNTLKRGDAQGLVITARAYADLSATEASRMAGHAANHGWNLHVINN